MWQPFQRIRHVFEMLFSGTTSECTEPTEAGKDFSLEWIVDRGFWLKAGGISGALAVMLGAFGAHGLRKHVTPDRVKSWETAAHYHLLHSVGKSISPRDQFFSYSRSPVMCMLAFVPRQSPMTGYLLTGGITLFSGSIYLLVLTQWKFLGPVTPIGGMMLIASWLSLAFQTQF